MPLFKHILAPFDFSEPSDAGVKFAQELAAAHDARLTILHVVQEPSFPSFYKLGALRIYGMVPDAEKLAWRALEKRFGEPDPAKNVGYSVVKGDPEAQIVNFADREDCDLIVISSLGTTGLEHIVVGSVAEKVVRHSRCPVLMVKAIQSRPAAKPKKSKAG